jgi:type II secretory pathway pseudopilin PulG
MRLKKRAMGFGILEMSLAIALFTMLLLFTMRDQQRTARLQVDRAAGEHLKTLQLGLQRYLDQNRAALLAGAPIAGVANPLQPTLAELRATNALSPSVGDTGANGLTYQMRVDRLPAGCVPGTDCTDVQALMWATTALLEGTVPQASRLAVMQAAGGNDIGVSNYLDPANPNNALQIVGQDGVWGFANPLGNQPGVVVARAGKGSSTDLGAFLRRDGSDAGMVGNLNMNDNRIDNPSELAAPAAGSVRFTVGGVEAGRVQAGGMAVANSLQFQNGVPVGGACTAPGALGRVSTADGNGVALCQGGAWRTIAIHSVLGSPCTTQGATATDVGGEQIVCIGGTYVSTLNRLPRIVDAAQFTINHLAGPNPPPEVVPAPQCGPNGQPRIVLVPQDPGVDFSRAPIPNRLRMTASPVPPAPAVPNRWNITLALVDENGNEFFERGQAPITSYQLRAVVRTSCEY